MREYTSWTLTYTKDGTEYFAADIEECQFQFEWHIHSFLNAIQIGLTNPEECPNLKLTKYKHTIEEIKCTQ